MGAHYAKISARALGDPQLTDLEVRVLGALGLHARKDGSGIFANSETLMREGAIARSSFFRAIAHLEELGYVHRESKPGRASRFTVRFDATATSPASGTGDATATSPASGTGDATATSPASGTGESRERHGRVPPAGRGSPASGTPVVNSPSNCSSNKKDDDDSQLTASSSSLDVFTAQPHRDSYKTFRATMASPAAFDSILRTVHEPLGGGTAYSWPIIGQALLEIAATGGKPAASSIRAFCGKIAQHANLGRGSAPALYVPDYNMPSDDEIVAAPRTSLRAEAERLIAERRLARMSPTEVVAESNRIFLASGGAAA